MHHCAHGSILLLLMFPAACRSTSASVIPLSPLDPNNPHEYEDISELLEDLPTVAGSSTGEFSITTCPAYMPTTRSAQLETEYDYVITPIERLVQPVGPDEPGEGPPPGQGSVNPQPEYEIMNVPDKDQTPQVAVDSEYERVNTGGSA